jgi:methionyl-tRNA formyltransferase
MTDHALLRPPDGGPRPVLFGLNNETTLTVLRGLMARNIHPAALILPEAAVPHLAPGNGDAFYVATPPEASLPLVSPIRAEDVVSMAWAGGLPVWVVGELSDPELVAAPATLEAEVGIVACFSRRIPQGILDAFPWGVLNYHPSLLPAYRGPAPLFWQFRDGAADFGVTVHQMDADLDTGDILAQRTVQLPRGQTGRAAAQLLAQVGVTLMAEQLALLARGEATPTPQADGGSYQGWPTEADFIIPAGWTAQQAYTFMRGTDDWGRPYPLEIAGETLLLSEALAQSEDSIATVQVRPNGDLWIPMASGTLWARPAGSRA